MDRFGNMEGVMENKKLNAVFAVLSAAVLLSFFVLIEAVSEGPAPRIGLAAGGFAGFALLLALFYRHNRAQLFRK